MLVKCISLIPVKLVFLPIIPVRLLSLNEGISRSLNPFREDLKRFPENGWSLRGLELALRAQGRTAEAVATKVRFDKSWAGADVEAP